jgi:predicted dehydrogenase
MKFLIAGLGSIGRRHLRNLLELGERDILLYRTHKGTMDDTEMANYPVERDLKAALDQNPDAVIVSNPTSLHMDVAIPAAEAGCHLLLEKPVSHNLDRMDELYKALRRGGGQVLVGYQFRFHPGLQMVSRMLSDGAIGRPLSVRAHWGEYLPNWHPWEDYRIGYSARPELGGGVVLTLCHPLDYLRWMLGDVQALWAFTGQISDLKLVVEDSAEIGLRFQNGVIGSIHLDYYQRPNTHKLEIIGTQGSLTWDNADGAAELYIVESGNWETYESPSDFERNQMFLDQMRHFLDVITGKTSPCCTLDDGVRALELALAVKQSQNMGQLIQFAPPS